MIVIVIIIRMHYYLWLLLTKFGIFQGKKRFIFPVILMEKKLFFLSKFSKLVLSILSFDFLLLAQKYRHSSPFHQEIRSSLNYKEFWDVIKYWKLWRNRKQSGKGQMDMADPNKPDFSASWNKEAFIEIKELLFFTHF